MEIKVLASGSTGNCYRIGDGKTEILLDAGIPIKQIRIGCDFRLSAIAGAFISHRHNDHSKAVCDLAKAGIDIYAPEDVFTAKGISGRRYNIIESGIIESKAEKWIIVGTLLVLPFDCHHDVPNLGYYIHSTETGENLLYFTDTYYIRPVFPNLHYIMAEANYSNEAIDQSISDGRIPISMKKRLVQSHMSIDNLLIMLQQNDLSKVKQIYLLHLSNNNSREDDFKKRVQEATGCEVYIC